MVLNRRAETGSKRCMRACKVTPVREYSPQYINQGTPASPCLKYKWPVTTKTRNCLHNHRWHAPNRLRRCFAFQCSREYARPRPSPPRRMAWMEGWGKVAEAALRSSRYFFPQSDIDADIKFRRARCMLLRAAGSSCRFCPHLVDLHPICWTRR